ncbi:MAG: SDR family NAD(P)-dependent oxidoreductase [Clostridia bacterium]
MNINKWFELNTHDLSGVNIAITGSTGGLGEWICMHLARLNANLIFLNRDSTKSITLENKIKVIYPNVDIQYIETHLEDLTSVNNSINKLKAMSVDMLILNAGVYNIPVYKMDSGYNNIFQINFLSQYYIAKELLPNLTKSSYGKIVALGSIAHNYSKLDDSDVDFSTRTKPSLIYGNSKRFLMASLQELLKDHVVKLSIVHPGITLTNMTNHYPKCINWLVKFGIKCIFPSPKIASLSIIKGIFDHTEYNTWIGPSIFNIWGKPKKVKLKTIPESEKIYEITKNIIT